MTMGGRPLTCKPFVLSRSGESARGQCEIALRSARVVEGVQLWFAVTVMVAEIEVLSELARPMAL